MGEEDMDVAPSEDSATTSPDVDGTVTRHLSIPPLSSLNLSVRTKQSAGVQGVPQDIATDRYGAYDVAANDGSDAAQPWLSSTYRWAAPSFYHRPLYFEQVNLERYGHFHKNWVLESVLSTAHFFGSATSLPYQLGTYNPCQRVYTLGHYRPGNCNPHQQHLVPLTWRGLMLQGLTSTALVFAL